jgi:hypothetical protein
MPKIKLRIADIIIQMKSGFALEKFSKKEKKSQAVERFNNFFYKGAKKPRIAIEVNIVDKLPEIDGKNIFITNHFQDGRENWRLLKKGKSYVYKSPLDDKKQVVLINENLDKITAYLLPKKIKGHVWNHSDIIYDFLQVLLIHYLAKKNEGIFTHAIGVKNLMDNKGFLFAGKSGAGKSTTARIWHKDPKAMVLNDDRIIVRKVNGKFFIYGSPWHGEFSDYLISRIESAPLEKLFFIYHSPKNIARKLSEKEAFNSLYPALFPTFWDKKCLANIASFCHDLIKNVPCYSLGFANNSKVIKFIRDIDQ